MTGVDGPQRTAERDQKDSGPPSVVISRAGLRDLFEARALEQACFGPDAWGYFELGWALLTPGSVRLKASLNGRMAGLVIGEPRAHEGVGWVTTLGVHPALQRQGIGRALLQACEAALPQRVIKLTVRRSNAAALALYNKFGYQRVSVWRRYYAGGEDGIVMEKVKTILDL